MESCGAAVLGVAWQGRHGLAGQGMELKEVAMNTERKDDGLDVAWREFDAAVERLRRAVCDLESVLGRKEEAAHE